MRNILFHIAAGSVAAFSFLMVLYALNTAGVQTAGAVGLVTLFALTALFFLSVQLILARLSTEPDPVRIRSDR